MENKPFLTINDLIKATGLSRGFFHLERKRGNLVFRKIGRRAIVLAEDFEVYVRNLKVAA